MDGSLGILFYSDDSKRWQVSTRGSFTSSQAIWALKWLTTHSILSRCTPGITYLFEIIYPENKIVIDYHGREELVLLGAYDSDGVEIINLKALNLGVALPERYKFSCVLEILAVCKGLPPNKEGFIVRLANGMRCKFKGDAYNQMHKHMSGITEKFVFDNLYNMVGNPKESLPEEFYDEYDTLEINVKNKIAKALQYMEKLEKDYTPRNNKDIAQDSEISDQTKTLIFVAKKQWRQAYNVAGQNRVRRMVFDLAEKL